MAKFKQKHDLVFAHKQKIKLNIRTLSILIGFILS